MCAFIGVGVKPVCRRLYLKLLGKDFRGLGFEGGCELVHGFTGLEDRSLPVLHNDNEPSVIFAD